jgi:hypothetical protein
MKSNKVGRPTKYQRKFCRKVISLMAKGYSKWAVASDFGVDRNTLYQWCKYHPDFREAVAIGVAKSCLYWEVIGMEAVFGRIKNFNVQAWAYIMYTRFGWNK